MNSVGRPSKYSKELVEEICEQIATTNKGIATILNEKEGYPTEKTFYNWLKDANNKDFLQFYAHAKERQADRLVAEILEIADETKNDDIETENGKIQNSEWINRSRLRVDSRKWLASKLLPKKYGDKMEVDQVGSLKITITKKRGT